ncbi:MAG TPA: hypothetical protein VGH47_04220, partial [Xanthobacteraceae bacterium]
MRADITRENAIELLAGVRCGECNAAGEYILFSEINNNGVGIRCKTCGKYHPFVKQKIMWLRGHGKRRANDIV